MRDVALLWNDDVGFFNCGVCRVAEGNIPKPVDRVSSTMEDATPIFKNFEEFFVKHDDAIVVGELTER